MNNYTEFTAKQIDATYINSLVELVNACRANEVEINEVRHYQNGFHVTFKGHKHADAICHDGSYGSPCPLWLDKNQYSNDWSRSGLWETYGFPWNHDDVSIHSAEELADYLLALNRGKLYGKFIMRIVKSSLFLLPGQSNLHTFNLTFALLFDILYTENERGNK